MKKILIFVCLSLFALTTAAFAQPRPLEKSGKSQTVPKATAPQIFEAKYEGGFFGYNDREKGKLKFDDANERLVFFGEDGKEKFAIPYKNMLVVSPQSNSVQSTGGKVVGAIPLPGAGVAGLFIKEKRRYLIVQFEDPDVDARGLANFKIDDKALLDSVIETLGAKGEMTQRGDAYYRPSAKNSEN